MINGDIVGATFYGVINEQQWNMVQFYEAQGLDVNGIEPEYFEGVIESLYNGVRALFSSHVVGALSTAFTLQGCRAENLFSEVEFGEYRDPTPLGGAIATDVFPSFTAVRFTSPTKRKGMKSAHKFLPGLVEANAAGNGVIAPAVLTAFQTFADNFGAVQFLNPAPLVTAELRPVAVKRIFEGVVNNKRRYRLPENSGEAVTYDTDKYTVYPYLTTMNSRKRGRGI